MVAGCDSLVLSQSCAGWAGLGLTYFQTPGLYGLRLSCPSCDGNLQEPLAISEYGQRLDAASATRLKLSQVGFSHKHRAI